MQRKSTYITFEGGEGTGKGTQQEHLAQLYLDLGRKLVMKTHEPGGGFGPKLREILLNRRENEGDIGDSLPLHLKAMAELHLFLADRAVHTWKVKRWLAEGYVVIQDRGVGSTKAYQGYARGLSLKMIHEMNGDVTDGLLPDVTILLDADPRDLRRRIQSRGSLSRFDREGIDFHQAVRKGFLEQALQGSDWVIVDALGTEEEVFERVRDVLRANGLIE